MPRFLFEAPGFLPPLLGALAILPCRFEQQPAFVHVLRGGSECFPQVGGSRFSGLVET